MMFQGNLGDNSTQCNQVTSLAIPAGVTITVANVTGSSGTVSYYGSLHEAAAGTIAAGANHTFTTPTWLTSSGISSVQITGTGY